MRKPVRVLMYPPWSDRDRNPFVRELVNHLPPSITVNPFSWLRYAKGHFDVLHLQWPEYLIMARTRPKRVLRRIVFVAFLASLTLKPRPIVVTVHNVTPHDQLGRTDRLLLRKLGHRVTQNVYLSPSLDALAIDDTLKVIPHPDYRRRISNSAAAPVGKDLLFFGTIRGYKGATDLVEVFTQSTALHDSKLVVAGEARDEAVANALKRIASTGGPRVDLRLAAVPETELHRLIASSLVVVVPYERIYNSGAVMLALTIGRPVLVRNSVTMRALANEVGHKWVMIYDRLTPEVIADAIARASSLDQQDSPDLSNRSPEAASDAYAVLYEELTND